MPDGTTTIAELRNVMRQFVDERDWERFHSPKNLVMGLAVETAELMEHFLWMDCGESRSSCQRPDRRGDIADELADVACHLFNLCNSIGIDLSDAVEAKMVKNRKKYPAEMYKGRYEAERSGDA